MPFYLEHIYELSFSQICNTKWLHPTNLNSRRTSNSRIRSSLSTTATEFQHKMRSGTTYVDRSTLLKKKIDRSRLSKDGKMEAVHGLVERRQTLLGVAETLAGVVDRSSSEY